MSKKEHNQEEIRIEDVLKRISAITGIKSNADLGKAIGVTRTTIYEWKSKNYIPTNACSSMPLRKVSPWINFCLAGVLVNRERRKKRRLENVWRSWKGRWHFTAPG